MIENTRLVWQEIGFLILGGTPTGAKIVRSYGQSTLGSVVVCQELESLFPAIPRTPMFSSIGTETHSTYLLWYYYFPFKIFRFYLGTQKRFSVSSSAMVFEALTSSGFEKSFFLKLSLFVDDYFCQNISSLTIYSLTPSMSFIHFLLLSLLLKVS